MHTGSVAAAVGSYLDARHHGGRWLVRIEDPDTARVVPGSASDILRTLETLNLLWDGDILHQSGRRALYREALAQLHAQGRTFECSCSRREVATHGDSAYPGTCRTGPQRAGPTATRFRISGAPVGFDDRIQGFCRQDTARMGDVVVRRRDEVVAYQLAVVVDDAAQGITDVVRGADLLDSTAWQIELQQALRLATPRYAHLPVITSADGGKLAKSRASLAPDLKDPGAVLFKALVLLRQRPPPEIAGQNAAETLSWAIANWKPDNLNRIRALPAL